MEWEWKNCGNYENCENCEFALARSALDTLIHFPRHRDRYPHI
jgi:hypothetical protein